MLGGLAAKGKFCPRKKRVGDEGLEPPTSSV
ncbi:hypothetical protein DSM3645_03248 [Blastopirellula marina DSM 3645]|uniref:Uncharacterized protein n=1 Tax=Blastopirellula marina DSM 3645 TaxID=314230 RepID=A3ZVW3_9BACT|nr:hypothetical protein DSM3645_03248 [Blastopirellula marina DSM 3645]